MVSITILYFSLYLDTVVMGLFFKDVSWCVFIHFERQRERAVSCPLISLSHPTRAGRSDQSQELESPSRGLVWGSAAPALEPLSRCFPGCISRKQSGWDETGPPVQDVNIVSNGLTQRASTPARQLHVQADFPRSRKGLRAASFGSASYTRSQPAFLCRTS